MAHAFEHRETVLEARLEVPAVQEVDEDPEHPADEHRDRDIEHHGLIDHLVKDEEKDKRHKREERIVPGDLNLIQEIRTTFLDVFMSNVTKLGNVGFIWILLTIILLVIPKTRKSGVILAAALIVDLILCNVILKPLVARIRPFDVNTAIQLIIAKPQDYSFPSGHTAASVASVVALYLAGEKRLWKIALILACFIAFSRMYLYVHYPTDVLGGAVVGVISGYIGYKVTLRMSRHSGMN